MRVLVVDDDKDVLAVLTRALERDGHSITAARSIAEARRAFQTGIDLLVLDLGLPDGSGLELCRELRRGESAIPILILTARTQVELRVQGLDAGADDYLTKPFALAELRARVRALARRGPVSRAFFHVHGSITLDFAGRRAFREGRQVAVTAREWAILELLASRVGRITTRKDLLDTVWGDTGESTSNSLEVLVARLRKKFGADLIKTLRGEGYSLSGSTQPDNPVKS